MHTDDRQVLRIMLHGETQWTYLCNDWLWRQQFTVGPEQHSLRCVVGSKFRNKLIQHYAEQYDGQYTKMEYVPFSEAVSIKKDSLQIIVPWWVSQAVGGPLYAVDNPQTK